MSIFPDYRRINTGCTNADPNEMFLHKGNHLDWNIHFMERLKDYNQLFNDLFLDRIIEEIGNDGWAIKFVQYIQTSPSFLVDIYLENTDYYQIIKWIIETYIPKEIKIEPSYRGTVTSYLKED